MAGNKSTPQTTWNLKPLFKSDNDPNIEKQRKVIQKKAYAFINKWKNRSDYLKNPQILKKALDEYEYLIRNYGTSGNEGFYFWLKSQQNQTDIKIRAKYNKVVEFGAKIQNDLEFFTLNIGKIPENKQPEFLNHKTLKDYKHFLEKIFLSAKYNLSEPEEKIINLFSLPISNWTKMTSSFLSKEERVVIVENNRREKRGFTEILTLMDSGNEKVRDTAAQAFNEIMEKNSEVAEWELNSIFFAKKISDEMRKMKRPDLGRHIADDIDSEVVDTLIKSVSDNFHIAKKYYRLKAKLLKVGRLKYHERNIPYGNLNKHYSFDDAIEITNRAFYNLDPQFSEIFKRFLQNGQVDAFPKKGKQSGAFCAYNLLSQPTYVLLNHTGKLNDVLTLAHEFGHGINDEFMRNQNALNFGTGLSVAEVSSTFMEDFILKEILKKADEELKLAIFMMKLNDSISTIFRQVACYNFEKELHQKFRLQGYIPKEQIGKIFQKHMVSYMGDYVEQSKGSENWWVYWSHIRNYFYVYSYASGLLISKSLQNSVEKNPRFIEKVKIFLATGLSESHRNTFKKLGIDITKNDFWNQGIGEIESLLSETEKLAKKLKKF